MTAGAGTFKHFLAPRIDAHRADLVRRVCRGCQGARHIGRRPPRDAARISDDRADIFRPHVAEAVIDRLSHGSGCRTVPHGMAFGEIDENVLMPGTDAGSRVAGDVVRTPAGGNRTAELPAVVEREGDVARRVTLAAMGERFADIRTAVPFRAVRGVCLKALVAVEQP